MDNNGDARGRRRQMTGVRAIDRRQSTEHVTVADDDELPGYRYRRCPTSVPLRECRARPTPGAGPVGAGVRRADRARSRSVRRQYQYQTNLSSEGFLQRRRFSRAVSPRYVIRRSSCDSRARRIDFTCHAASCLTETGLRSNRSGPYSARSPADRMRHQLRQPIQIRRGCLTRQPWHVSP